MQRGIWSKTPTIRRNQSYLETPELDSGNATTCSRGCVRREKKWLHVCVSLQPNKTSLWSGCIRPTNQIRMSWYEHGSPEKTTNQISCLSQPTNSVVEEATSDGSKLDCIWIGGSSLISWVLVIHGGSMRIRSSQGSYYSTHVIECSWAWSGLHLVFQVDAPRSTATTTWIDRCGQCTEDHNILGGHDENE